MNSETSVDPIRQENAEPTEAPSANETSGAPMSGLDRAAQAFMGDPSEETAGSQEQTSDNTQETLPEDDVDIYTQLTEDEQGESQEESSNEENESLYTLKVDGEEIQASLEELKRGYSGNKSYTNKAQALAEERRAFEEQQAVFAQQQQELAHTYQQMQQAQGVQEKTPEYWEKLRDEDPIQWAVERDELREQQVNQHLLQQEEMLRQQQQQEQQHQQLQEHIDSERNKLTELIPTWANEEVADKERAAIVAYGVRLGYSKEELAQTYDSRAVVTMRKAALYDQIMGKRKGLTVTKQKAMASGSQGNGDPQAASRRSLRANLRKSGSLEDAAKLFM